MHVLPSSNLDTQGSGWAGRDSMDRRRRAPAFCRLLQRLRCVPLAKAPLRHCGVPILKGAQQNVVPKIRFRFPGIVGMGIAFPVNQIFDILKMANLPKPALRLFIYCTVEYRTHAFTRTRFEKFKRGPFS